MAHLVLFAARVRPVNSMGKRWTEQEDRVIIRQYNELGIKAIARILNRSERAVSVRAYLLEKQDKRTKKEAKQRLSSSEEEFILQNHAQLSLQEIADALGTTRFRIMHHVKQMQSAGRLPHKQRKWGAQEKAQLAELRNRGLKVREIALLLDRTEAAITLQLGQKPRERKENFLKIHVRIPAALVEQARKIGNGNIAAGIRQMLADYGEKDRESDAALYGERMTLDGEYTLEQLEQIVAAWREYGGETERVDE